jgi:hypothetical protein
MSLYRRWTVTACYIFAVCLHVYGGCSSTNLSLVGQCIVHVCNFYACLSHRSPGFFWGAVMNSFVSPFILMSLD